LIRPLRPDAERRLGVEKMKGNWNWSTPTSGAVETLPGEE
jgi:hypothetical protein